MQRRKAKVTLPTHVMIPRKTMDDKRVNINLNQYRNWNYRVETQIKHLYKDLCSEALKDTKEFLSPVRIKYRLFRGNKRSCDTNNVLCIIDKYFQDVLKERHIEDDDYKHVVATEFIFGGLHKGEHYVEVTIEEIDHVTNNGS